MVVFAGVAVESCVSQSALLKYPRSTIPFEEGICNNPFCKMPELLSTKNVAVTARSEVPITAPASIPAVSGLEEPPPLTSASKPLRSAPPSVVEDD